MLSSVAACSASFSTTSSSSSSSSHFLLSSLSLYCNLTSSASRWMLISGALWTGIGEPVLHLKKLLRAARPPEDKSMGTMLSSSPTPAPCC